MKYRHSGFSLVEMIIITSIIVITSSLFIANYRRGEQLSKIKETADSLQSAFRQMQNNVLSGKPHPSGNPTRDYGVIISSTQYQTFVEQSDGSGGAINRVILETKTFPTNVSIGTMTFGGQTVTSGTVLFFPPFGDVKVTAGTYNETKNIISAYVINFSGSTATRTVTVDGISGRVQTQ